MQRFSESLRQELLAIAADDLAVREELVAEGELGHGYHPRMEAVHRRNAARLAEVVEQHGWPGESLVGEDGAHAAWLTAQHAIGNPHFMRRCLALLQHAAAQGEVPAWQPAMLEDRIRMYEGRPQIYGSQFLPDERGRIVPYTIDNPEGVEERRRAVGLIPLEEKITQLSKQVVREQTQASPQWREEYEQWLRSVGWRE